MRKNLFIVLLIITCPLIAVPFIGRNAGALLRADGERHLNHSKDTTAELVAMVQQAAEQLKVKGEAAFKEFRVAGSRWRSGENYIFVLDPGGNMIVHADPGMEGKNQLALKDINGRPIIRGLIKAATEVAGKPGGWYHYQWPVPGGWMARWKSSYVQLVQAPSGKRYIVGSGMYNDRMERDFVVSTVQEAVSAIEKKGTAAFPLLHDPTGPFLVKEAYVFVIDTVGVELVNPAFPSLEGRVVMDLKDTRGAFLVRKMFDMVERNGSGWVDYMWPKPGESVSTQKSTYVSKARMGNQWVLVGCGVYLSDAPKEVAVNTISAPQLMELVRKAAAVLAEGGEKAFADFRQQGSQWLHDDTYIFVWTLDGTRIFHAANPQGVGEDVHNIKDALGRPWGKMFLEAASTPSGEGWVHYLYPKPGDMFPVWKSTFVKRVAFPSGQSYIVGCGIYNMQMDKALIEDVVDRAALLVEERGPDAFAILRDKKGPFVFMDTYVFVDNAAGVELVNAGQPSIEGKNILNEKDAAGKLLAKEYINAALERGSAWVDYVWYKPGSTTTAKKNTFVRKVVYNGQTYVIGAGIYQ